MRFLLDTHTFLWWVTNDPRLSARARTAIGKSDTEVFFSAVSGWEIIIKAQLGKLQLPTHPKQFVIEHLAMNSFKSMPILLEHTLQLHALPMHHHDHFDRILIAQSQSEHLPIITADPQFASYDVEVIL